MNDVLLQHKAQISIGCNYRFIIAEEQQIAELVAHFLKGGTVMYQRILKALREGDALVGKLAIQCLNKINNVGLQERGIGVQECHNLVPSVLRNSMATLISGTTVTPTFKANYFALGTGSAAPNNADTQLGAEALRSLFTNRYSSANVAYLDVFYGVPIVGGNSYTEAAIFVDGTGSADSGYLLSRTAQNIVLGASQTLTVNCSITVS